MTSHDKLKELLERLRRTLPAGRMSRFIATVVMTQSASLARCALVSLAPLLVLLRLTASLYPSAHGEQLHQFGRLAGRDAEALARTVIEFAAEAP